MKSAYLFATVLFTVLVFSLAGCGGGNDSKAFGGVRLSALWPDTDQSFSTSSVQTRSTVVNSLRIVIINGDEVLHNRVLARPDRTLGFFDLPPRALTVNVSSYSSEDGTGAALATHSRTVTVPYAPALQMTVGFAPDTNAIRMQSE